LAALLPTMRYMGEASRVDDNLQEYMFLSVILTSFSLVDVISRFSRPWYMRGLMTVCRENSGAGPRRAATREHDNVGSGSGITNE
jgi:hypothetical protein